MKKVVIVSIIFFFMSILLSACAKQSEINDTDKSYVFTFDDIKDFKMDEYKVKTMRNGKDYFYTKSNSKKNGFSCMYKVILNDENDNEVSLNTSVNLQPDAERANQLFDSNVKTVKVLYGSSVKDIEPDKYKVNQLLVVDSEDYFSVILCKDNLFYSIVIDGLSINEEQVKDNLLKKVEIIFNTEIKD